MSAVLKSEVLNIRPIQENDFPSVLKIEQASYKFPWSERIFLDCVAAGYHCRVLLKGRRMLQDTASWHMRPRKFIF